MCHLLDTAALHIPLLGSGAGGEQGDEKPLLAMEPTASNSGGSGSSKRSLSGDNDQTSIEENPAKVVCKDWPRFIVIRSALDNGKDQIDYALIKLDPFAIDRGIKGIAGTVKNVKKLERSRQILIECDRRQQAENLLKAKTLADVPIIASSHKSLNSCKGVIRCKELRETSVEVIKGELAEQGVSDVRRIVITRMGKQIQTNTYILTFEKPAPPSEMKIGYLKVDVSLYIPNPLRCFKCQRYGHGSSTCTRESVCPRCGSTGHDQNCQALPNCLNCGGDHMATSKDCPVWKREKEIQKVKTQNRITYPEARKLVEQYCPTFTQTFASVASKKAVTICTQTEPNWWPIPLQESADTPLLGESSGSSRSSPKATQPMNQASKPSNNNSSNNNNKNNSNNNSSNKNNNNKSSISGNTDAKIANANIGNNNKTNTKNNGVGKKKQTKEGSTKGPWPWHPEQWVLEGP